MGFLLAQFLHPAAAGARGAPFRGAAADAAIAGAFTGNGVGKYGRLESQGRKGAQGYQCIDHGEKQED